MDDTKIIRKKILGLTGQYSAGKNHVACILERRGLAVLDVDILGHQVIEAEKEPIMARFGRDIAGEDGKIDRKLLGKKVFGNKEDLAALEEIVHPEVNRKTLAWIDSRKEKACAINAALLHRSSAAELLDCVLIVEAPFLVRLFRAKKRDKLPWLALIRRFQSQKRIEYQFYSGKTDIYRVSNSLNCANSGPSGGKKGRARLENRIDEIMSLLGIM